MRRLELLHRLQGDIASRPMRPRASCLAGLATSHRVTVWTDLYKDDPSALYQIAQTGQFCASGPWLTGDQDGTRGCLIGCAAPAAA